MAYALIMPRQGNTVESCIITNWLVKEGDTVEVETNVCEVETDKASFEVPAGTSGTLLKIIHAAGDDVPVLEPIAVIGAAGEDWQAALKREKQNAVSNEQLTMNNEQRAVSREPLTVNSEQGTGNRELADQGISPRARMLAGKEALPTASVTGSGPGGRIIERDVRAALEKRPLLTAAAKASGIGGRVTVDDLSSSLSAYTETPVKGIRKVISERMLASLAESAQFTLNASARVTRLQELRSRMKASEGGLSKITVNDFILFAVSRLLPRFLYMNAHKLGDIIRTYNQIHLGIAVDTERGLMVPVIRNANLLSLAQISAEAKRLASACQSASVKPDELTGSTFSVTNLGSMGITGFTPVLNTPEAAILGVCGIEMKPVSQSKSESSSNDCCCEPHIGFSLTINHQVVDGAPAARFLKDLCEAIADIDLLLAAG
jgi:pyruvate dehydrogenase E2 component (dihydrolipoamide acetyltransferase)